MLSDVQIEKLADRIVVERIRVGAPIIKHYEVKETLREICQKGDLNLLQLYVTLMVELPRVLRDEYRDPCYSCRLTYKEEEEGYCSNCRRRGVKVIECKKLNLESPIHAVDYICYDCCDEQRLLKERGRTRKFRPDLCPYCSNFYSSDWTCSATITKYGYIQLDGESRRDCKDFARA